MMLGWSGDGAFPPPKARIVAESLDPASKRVGGGAAACCSYGLAVP
jgi:hypothetical protein